MTEPHLTRTLELNQPSREAAFTLIELSIMLVIIGLIVGGVLVGQDLIRAAGVRGQITQIEKYQTAVNTFRGKYGGLPGDLNAAGAMQYGLTTRSGGAGDGDGNGSLQAVAATCGGATPEGLCFAQGESLLFWQDLYTVGLVEGAFTSYGVPQNNGIPDTGLGQYVPSAIIGGGNYVVAWSGMYDGAGGQSNLTGNNYFALVIPHLNVSLRQTNAGTGLTVYAAYNIDRKIDDGIPQTGRVMALFPTNCGGHGLYAYWSKGSQTDPTVQTGCDLPDWVNRTQVNPNTTATAVSGTSCYDNNNNAGQPQQYSISQNGGSGVNCALSIQFQ